MTKRKKFSGARELRTGKHPQGAASRSKCSQAAQNRPTPAGSEYCRRIGTTDLRPACCGNSRAALQGHPPSRHEQRRPARPRTPPSMPTPASRRPAIRPHHFRYQPPEEIAAQPLVAGCGENHNMYMDAQYTVVGDSDVRQIYCRPYVLGASNADCKLPFAPPSPQSVAVTGPSAPLLIQQKI